MPEGTLKDFADHGEVEADTIRPAYADAATVMLELERVGVDYDDVVQVLEDEGVEKFIVSWKQLLDQIESQLSQSGEQK
jgi:transaldolase